MCSTEELHINLSDNSQTTPLTKMRFFKNTAHGVNLCEKTRLSMSVKGVNAGRFDAFRIRYAKHRQTVPSSLRFASSFFRAAKRVFL